MSDHTSDFSPTERDQLEQELLELHFGCHDDPDSLRARLAAEPALRMLQAAVLQQAKVLEAAAKPELPHLELPVAAAVTAKNRRRFQLLRSAGGRMVGAGVLAALVMFGFFIFAQISASRWVRFQSDHLHLTVSAPRAVPAGAPWSFTVEAQDLRGDPAACRVRWQAFGKDTGSGSAVLAAGEVPVSAGRATVAMAADLRAPERIEVIATHATDEARQVLQLSTAAAGPLVHVSTDRPVYRPGEPVFVRTVLLDRVTMLPVPQQSQLQARLLDGRGAVVAQEWQPNHQNGTSAFVLAIPPGSAGGPHRVEISSPQNAFPTESAELVVRSFQQPRLKKDIVLDRMTYAPGARGSAQVTAERMGGAAAAGAAAVAKLVIDGTDVWTDRQILDDRGIAHFRFAIPSDVAQGSARFVATFTDGGVVETELKPFVVPTGKVLVAGFPEGGDLIAGVQNGLYLECTDPLGRAIDTAGEVVDDRGDRIAKFRTAHQGRCHITFVPRSGRSYHVRLPGQTEPFALPAVHDSGIALHLADEQIDAGAPLRLGVAGRGDGPWLLGVFCRGVLVGQTTLRADERGELRADALVELPPHAAGVLRTTVFDRNLSPIAERLVRREATRRIDVELVARGDSLSPGASQQITVRTKDENGKAMPAVVGLTVTDLAAVSLGSEPRVGLFDQAMLFADVERVENLGDFFAGAEHAARNADLLLGTRGWRRFVWRNDDAAQAAIAAHGGWAEGVLAREGFSHTPQVLSNLRAANSAGTTLASDARRGQRTFLDAAGITALLLVLLLLGEGIAFGLRTARMRPWLQALGGAVGALLVMAAFFSSLMNDSFGPPPEAAALAARPADDFDAEELAPADGFLAPHVRDMPMDNEDPGAWKEMAFDGRAWNQAIALGAPVAQKPAEVMLDDLIEQKDELFERRKGNFARFAEVQGGGGGQADFYLDVDRRSAAARQYAHQHRSLDGRSDFTATVLWNPMVITDASGEATATFATSDAVTTWLVQADAHAAAGTGRVGQGAAKFLTRLPFSLDVKLPDEVSAGDDLWLPISAIAEGLASDKAALVVKATGGLRIVGTAPATIPLAAGRGRALVQIAAASTAENSSGTLTIEGSVGRFTDSIRHTIKIAPRGFPHRRSFGGSVVAGTPGTVIVTIPSDAVAGSGHVLFKVFPSPLCGLVEGLQGLLQEPHGCFEQASSSNYPNTLVLSLLDATGDNLPVVAARARELLPRGYAKITGYECKQLGYEWFGGDPGHEALTAYGLLQFCDMQKVYDVDAAMVERTRQWLLARRDGKGGYQRNSRALDQFGGAPQPTTDAYVTYALLQSGVPADQLKTEIEALALRSSTGDAYELALISSALHLAGRPEAALTRQRLATLQKPDGSLRGEASITRSGGNDLTIETTGFAVLAWLRDPAFAGNVRSAADFLHRSRGASGRFGTTQATIVALRALTAYATENRGMREAGTLRILEGDTLLAERAFTAGEHTAMEFELWNRLSPGAHTLRVEVEGGGTALPWACDVAYHSELPADDASAIVSVRTELRSATVTEGDTVALDVTVQNRTAEGQPMALAIIGLPAGLELPTRVLEDLQKAQSFAFWELNGRELALYWRDLEPEAVRQLTLDLVARIPGQSTGPASRSYLYYTPDQKRWATPLAIEVTPR